MKMTKHYILILLLAGISNYSFAEQVPTKKKDIQRLNKTIIFDLFLNYELSSKNGNLSTLIDYLNGVSSEEYRMVNMQGNMGSEDETIDFVFENDVVSQINYVVRSRIFRYGVKYNGSAVDYITIAGKKKITITYDQNGLVKSIERNRNGATMEYNFEFVEPNRADIKLFVVQGEKRRPSSRKYYIEYDKSLKLRSYYLDVFSGKEWTYDKKGNLISFKFSNVNGDAHPAKWEYEFDEKGNWIKRTFEDFYLSRTLTYPN